MLTGLIDPIRESNRLFDACMLPSFLAPPEVLGNKVEFQKEAMEAWEHALKQDVIQAITKFKNLIKKIRGDPEGAAIKGIAELTRTILSLGLCDVGVTKAASLTRVFTQGLQNEMACLAARVRGVKITPKLRAYPLTTIFKESGEIFGYVLRDATSGTNISHVKKALTIVERNPKLVRVERSVAGAVERVVEVHDQIKKSKILEDLTKMLKKSKPSGKSKVVFYQREAIIEGGYVEDGYKIIFRRDFGKNAHPIKTKGYVDPVNHYNIEIQKQCRGRWKDHFCYHIIVDETGNVIDFF